MILNHCCSGERDQVRLSFLSTLINDLNKGMTSHWMVQNDGHFAISCNADHVILNKWVTRTMSLKGCITTKDSIMDHVAVVETTRTVAVTSFCSCLGRKH